MIEVLNYCSVHIQSISAIVTTLAMVILVIVTCKYTNATNKMAETMYNQFVYDHKPYLSVEYENKPNHALIKGHYLELKNHSEKSRITVHYNLFIIHPANTYTDTELQKPETLENSKLVMTQDEVIEPNKSGGRITNVLIQSDLEEMGVDLKKNYQYEIVVEVNCKIDIPDMPSFYILKCWQVAEFTEGDNFTSIIPKNLELHN